MGVETFAAKRKLLPAMPQGFCFKPLAYENDKPVKNPPFKSLI
jgi:hypothetical protein